jgi:hypothetical protein
LCDTLFFRELPLESDRLKERIEDWRCGSPMLSGAGISTEAGRLPVLEVK